MGIFKDLTGQRFGRLVVIGLHERRRRTTWLARCDCGGTKVVSTGSLTRPNPTRSCGCLMRETTAALGRSRKGKSLGTAKDLTGQRFGRLVVIERSGLSKHRQVDWRTRCDCGGSKVVSTGHLIKPKPTRSCGCLKRETSAAQGRANRKLCPALKAIILHLQRRNDRQQRQTNPTKNLAARVSGRLRVALRYVKVLKTSPTFKALGYTPAILRLHLERQFTAGMSWENMALWQIDHIVPLATAQTAADVIALNQLSNLRPMWPTDNNRKKARREHLL